MYVCVCTHVYTSIDVSIVHPLATKRWSGVVVVVASAAVCVSLRNRPPSLRICFLEPTQEMWTLCFRKLTMGCNHSLMTTLPRSLWGRSRGPIVCACICSNLKKPFIHVHPIHLEGKQVKHSRIEGGDVSIEYCFLFPIYSSSRHIFQISFHPSRYRPLSAAATSALKASFGMCVRMNKRAMSQTKQKSTHAAPPRTCTHTSVYPFPTHPDSI